MKLEIKSPRNTRIKPIKMTTTEKTMKIVITIADTRGVVAADDMAAADTANEDRSWREIAKVRPTIS